MGDAKLIADAVSRLRFRLFTRLWCSRLSSLLCPIGFGGGALLIPATGLAWLDRKAALTTATGFLLLALLGAVWGALRTLPDRAAAGRLLAAVNRTDGGVLLAQLEGFRGDWPEPETLRLPRVSWQPGASWLPALLAVGFLFGSALFPPLPQRPPDRTGLDLRSELQPLQQQLEELQMASLLPESRVLDLKRELEALAEQAKGDDPAKSFEGLEHLNSVLRQEREQVTARLTQALGEQAQLSELLRRLKEQGRTPTPELSSALAELLEKLEADPQPTGTLPRLNADEPLTAEQLERMLQELQRNREQLEQALARCREEGNSGTSTARQEEELVDFLNRNFGDSIPEELLQACDNPDGSGGNGDGGVSRGRGDAPISWVDRDLRFYGQRRQLEAAAPPTRPGAGELLFETRSAPETGPELPVAAGPELTAPDGAGLRTAPGHPRHRGAIRRYFSPTPQAP